MNLRQQYNKYLLDVYSPFDFVPLSGKGSRLYGENGEEIIDFAGGIAVNALGQAHPVLIQALTDQANTLWHVSNIMTNKPAVELAQKLVENTCMDKVFFCNSGAEANEACFKLARRYAVNNYSSDKNKIISFVNGFHGRTLFSVTVGGQSKYCEGFAPLPSGISHGVFNDCALLERMIDDSTALVVLETVQAEGGIITATPEFLATARRLCDKFNCMLMFDEVQTGMGRTGKLFSYMHYTIEPDIISSAKALGGGFPIGALLVKEKYHEGLQVGSHGCTFGGNPLATAVANAAFDLINTPEVLDGVIQRQEIFRQKLTAINQRLNIYKEIRGMGLLIGAELQEKYHGRAREIINLGLKHGVSVLNASPNVTRLTPSLIIPLEDIELGCDRLEKALEEFIN